MDIPTFRKERGLTQVDFAKLMTDAGFPATQGLVSQWEQGEVKLTPDRATQIERATGIPCEDLRPDLVWTRDEAGKVTGYHVPLAA